MIQAPLLLKYKCRDTFDGYEIDGYLSDMEIGRFKNPECERWKLQPPKQIGLLSKFTSKSIRYDQYHYRKLMVHAVGDRNPVLVYFYRGGESMENVQTYQLPKNYIKSKVMDFSDDVRSILQEYERNRDGNWQTRILVGGHG